QSNLPTERKHSNDYLKILHHNQKNTQTNQLHIHHQQPLKPQQTHKQHLHNIQNNPKKSFTSPTQSITTHTQNHLHI
ncbi:hypothetical protein, partial [Staphylococcus epidermidis]|uniref:hypothetical protein n=1 Tax=Staphylococcus epidermidis TaxID=1282 RepID=UPI001C92C9E6